MLLLLADVALPLCAGCNHLVELLRLLRVRQAWLHAPRCGEHTVVVHHGIVVLCTCSATPAIRVAALEHEITRSEE
jgi:hypothetical protein